ncbi:hypothetical protein V6C03_05510 [Methyloligella sp. 2.7D]|uniref:hypothetical protein n=1 Tax=unclassified Methyloligella TaxID=2625955 RepID=UPI00157CD0BA|nr:hypothetical protein [Methyloligella sp. GL2]QKP78619.1 hypothetical protein HT051_14940 [Methyloligella sp. GL2]
MIELVITACLLSGSKDCQKIEVPVEEGVSLSACLKTAHDRALDWQADHAEYMVVGWQCTDTDKAAEK